MTAFCTYFDRNYIPQGLALQRSLARADTSADLWILSLDEETRSILTALDLNRVRVVSLDELLAFEPRLRQARDNRPALEFYYACTAQLVRYVAATAVESKGVTYVDADVFFFGDPTMLYCETPKAEILLVEHRSGDPKLEASRGRFNLCFIHFAPTENAFRALEWWCEMTLQSTAMGDGNWGDQKYLDRFPDLFAAVGVLRTPATTLAPWNVWQHTVSSDGTSVKVDGRPLVAYHFARLLVIGPHLFSPIRREWLPRSALRSIYKPYVREIRESIEKIRSVEPAYSVGHTRRNRRGLILGMLAGRLFYEGRLGLLRLGFYIPNTRKELRAHRHAVLRRLSSRTEAFNE